MFAETIFVLLAVFAALALGLVSGSYNASFSLNGVAGQVTSTYSGENAVTANPTVLQARAATLTTRTTDDTGTLTMTDAGHGVTTGARIDLYWSGGSCYGVIVGTVSGTSVPLASRIGGDVLPAQGTAIVVGICNEAAFNVVGDNMQQLVASSPGVESYFVYADGSSSHLATHFTSAGGGYHWGTGSGVTNPIAGDTLTKVFVSHANVSASLTTLSTAALTN